MMIMVMRRMVMKGIQVCVLVMTLMVLVIDGVLTHTPADSPGKRVIIRLL